MSASTSARTHTLTIWISFVSPVIAIAALMVSYLAYRASSDTLLLNRYINRSVVQPSTARLLANWLWLTGATYQPMQIELTLKNSGKLFTNNISTEIYATVAYESSSSVFDSEDMYGGLLPDHAISKTADSVSPAKLLPDNLGPGEARTYQLEIPEEAISVAALKDSGRHMERITLMIQLTYDDVIGKYKDEVCFNTPLNKSGVFEKGDELYPCSAAARTTVKAP